MYIGGLTLNLTLILNPSFRSHLPRYFRTRRKHAPAIRPLHAPFDRRHIYIYIYVYIYKRD